LIRNWNTGVYIWRGKIRVGHHELEGVLAKLGFIVSPGTVKNVMFRHGIPPAPECDKLGTSWRDFLAHYKDQILACDFFTVETVGLKTLYVLFFIEIGSWRVHLAGCTQHPKAAWVEQQARQMLWKADDDGRSIRYLLHDNDQKFTNMFDAIFGSRRIEVKTPASSCPQYQRLCGTMGPVGARKMFGPPVDLE
jgi:putative transposase